jgi:hypothetical protein
MIITLQNIMLEVYSSSDLNSITNNFVGFFNDININDTDIKFNVDYV